MTENHPQQTTGLHILVLDDEPIVCKRLKPVLQKFGHQVETYTDSASAMARLHETTFDIVITDLKMEGTDGIQILNAAKETSPDTQVIIITGFATLETARESYQKGAVEFLAKPFKLSDIVECVQRIEARKATPRDRNSGEA